VKNFRPNLVGKVHPEVERYIRRLQDEIEELRLKVERMPKGGSGSGGGAAAELAGLVGVLAQPELRSGATDPELESVSTQEGTVTSVNITAGTGIAATGGPITSSGSITVSVTNAVVRSTASKITAAAPYANDGYVEMTVNGVLLKIMTTA
jgi:hypothetical protein